MKGDFSRDPNGNTWKGQDMEQGTLTPCLSLTLLGIVCKQCCNYKTPSTNWFQLPGNLQHRETIKCKLRHALQHYLLLSPLFLKNMHFAHGKKSEHMPSSRL